MVAMPAARAEASFDARPCNDSFRALLGAFRTSGGTARADDLARLLTDNGDGEPDSRPSLNELLDRAEVFGFEWRGSVWLPMFQFNLRQLSVQRAPQQVRAELMGPCPLDGWECATWFARPHNQLDGHAPVGLLATDLPSVLDAARADRWLLNG